MSVGEVVAADFQGPKGEKTFCEWRQVDLRLVCGVAVGVEAEDGKLWKVFEMNESGTPYAGEFEYKGLQVAGLGESGEPVVGDLGGTQTEGAQVLELGERCEAGIGDGSAVLEVEGLERGEGGEMSKCLVVNAPYVS